jgi:hypothetical protein
MINKETSRTNFQRNGGRFNGCIVSAIRDVVERDNQLSRGVQGSMLQEEICEVIKAACIKVSSIVMWIGGAVGTSNSMVFAEQPRESVIKVVPAEWLVVADMAIGERG